MLVSSFHINMSVIHTQTNNFLYVAFTCNISNIHLLNDPPLCSIAYIVTQQSCHFHRIIESCTSTQQSLHIPLLKHLSTRTFPHRADPLSTVQIQAFTQTSSSPLLLIYLSGDSQCNKKVVSGHGHGCDRFGAYADLHPHIDCLL